MKRKNRLQMIFAVMLCAIAVIFGWNGSSGAVDTSKTDKPGPPIEVSGTGLPNIMFIFDNSNSMQEAPYPDTNGNLLIPNMEWHKGYTVVADQITGTVDNVYVEGEATEVAIPAQTQPALAGTTEYIVTSSDGNQTSTVPGDLSKVYDTEGSYWGTVIASNYTKRIMRIITSTGTQLVSITGVDTANEYWAVSTQVGYTNFYYKKNDSGCTHKYNIPVGSPGAVTMQEADAKWVCDANVNWTQVDTDFNTKFKGAFIEITDGTNEGEKRKITVCNVTEKRWEVESAFTAACDLTTKYRILNMSDSLKQKAYGGNHPASKLYQAKKALLAVLNSDALKDAGGNYKMNMGFATYMSARVPRVTARYYKAEGSSSTVFVYKGMYKRQKSNTRDFYNNNLDKENPPTTFNSGSWEVSSSDGGAWETGKTHTNVTEGYTFYGKVKVYSVLANGTIADVCLEQSVRYTVTSISNSPATDLPDRYKFVCTSDSYLEYAWQSPVAVESCNNLPQMPDTYSEWQKVQEGEDCYQGNSCTEEQYYSYYNTGGTKGMFTTYGDYNITDSTAAGYIDKDTNKVVPKPIGTGMYDAGYMIIPDIWMLENGLHSTSLDSPLTVQCQNEDGITWDDCSLGNEGKKRVVLKQVCTDATCSSGKKDVPANVVDTTYFTYPGEGTTERPHGWSYRRTADKYVYMTNKDNNPPDTAWRSQWGDSNQKNPYFPADSKHDNGQTGSIADSGDTANDFANHRGDDQLFFVNFPNYVDSEADHYGDDVSGNNVTIIKSFMGLGRVKSPSDNGYWGDNKLKINNNAYDYTMMPYTDSLPVNMRDEVVTGTGTPLAACLGDAKKYYDSYVNGLQNDPDDGDKLTQNGCRNNYIILLTDGLETAASDPDNAPKNAAAALLNDLDVKTFVIGFGMNESSKTKLNAIAEAGGTEKAYFASSSDELVSVLINDIFNSLVGKGAFSQSSATLAQEIKTDDDLRIYYSYFDYPGWTGHMDAYLINMSDGSIGDPVPGWGASCSTEAVSDAGCQIKAQGASNRKIYTWITGTVMTEFITANMTTLKTPLNIGTQDIDGVAPAGTDADATAVIGYVRDPGYDGGKYAGSRSPDWLLGDIWHSTPVVVTAPGFDFSKKGYDTFKAAAGVSDRPKMIYVGANDGMLHAINDSDGKERWAYIPKCLLGKVQELQYGHRYMVDGPITVADLDLDTTANKEKWTTVLVGGLRDGGNYYYALDVTLPATPKPLWEMTDDDTSANSVSGTMGNTWSKAAMGIINIGGVETPVVFVGGGYSPNTANKGNKFYILNAVTGAILKEFTVGETDNNVPGEALTVRYREIGGKAVDFFRDTELDDEYKGNIEVVYFGDTSGALWRIGTEVTDDVPTFDGGLNSEKNGNQYSTWNPKLVKLYQPSEAGHPIFYKPDVADYPDQGKCRFILFGTGNGANPNDPTQQYFCEIKDPSDKQIVNPGESLVTWKTGADNVPALGAREQVLSNPVVFQGKVYFTTYMPPQISSECLPSFGTSYLYIVNVSTCSSKGGIGKRGYLGAGIATSPVIAAPKVYVHIESGPPGDATPETSDWEILTMDTTTGSLKSAAAGGTGAGQMIYWREIE